MGRLIRYFNCNLLRVSIIRGKSPGPYIHENHRIQSLFLCKHLSRFKRPFMELITVSEWRPDLNVIYPIGHFPFPNQNYYVDDKYSLR